VQTPTLIVTPRFNKSLRSLPPHRAEAAVKALKKFMESPLRPGLNFEKLKQLPEDYWSIRSGKGDRVILKRIAEHRYEVVDVGPHDVYDRLKRG
jgi:mRNA-degrading endonuclease RelE of RelBE toxin-antitoxin system